MLLVEELRGLVVHETQICTDSDGHMLVGTNDLCSQQKFGNDSVTSIDLPGLQRPSCSHAVWGKPWPSPATELRMVGGV
jgi:hypothetical protein